MKKPESFSDPIYITRPLLPELGDVIPYMESIWESKRLSNQAEFHTRLESELATYLNAEYLRVFCNGTLSLTLALMAMNVKGEVITTPFTFPATPHSILMAGATPIYTDIDPLSMCLDPGRIEEAITPATEAILGVHVYGVPCDVSAIQKIANRHGLKVIYDAAHAFNTLLDGAPICSFGDATMYSFHATKLFHTFEGGCVVSRKFEVDQQIQYLRNFGIKDELTVVKPGVNAKMNELQSAIGLEMLRIIGGELERRARIKALYEKGFSQIEGITMIQMPDNVSDSLQYLVVRVDKEQFGVEADVLYEELREFNIYARRYFYPLCTSYDYNRHNGVELPVAEQVAEEVLCFPFFGEMSSSDVEHILSCVAYIRHKNNS